MLTFSLSRRRTAIFLRESVVLFGFLNGLFLALGVNPGATLLETLHAVVSGLASGVWIDFFFAFAPLALLAAALWAIWRRGKWLGLLAVAVAFLSGMTLLTDPKTALFLLAAAMGIGIFATS